MEAASLIDGSKSAAAAVPSMLPVPIPGLKVPALVPVPLNPVPIPGLKVPVLVPVPVPVPVLVPVPVVVPVAVVVPAALALEGNVHPEKLGSAEERVATPVKSQVAPVALFFWK